MAVKYLVPDGNHLPVTGADGKPDHRLMGAAWAALHKGFRGHTYAGPNKDAAISKLSAMYKSEGMQVPNVAPASDSQIFVNAAAIDEKGHVQLAPYGDFPNVDNRGNRVIQRFEKTDAENIVNEFNRLTNLPARLLGLAWYIGHPDHPRFRNMNTDTRAYGRVKSLEASEDGLYGNVKFNSAGKALLDGESFHGHSVNWKCLPNGRDRGLPVYRPVSLKSVGFTNEPAIPVIPASMANANEDDLPGLIDQLANLDEPDAKGLPDPDDTSGMIIPPKLKLIAGFKADEDVTMDQIIAALEKARPPIVANQGGDMKEGHKEVELTINDKKYSVVLANEEIGDLQSALTKLAEDKDKASQNFANERKARATLLVDQLVKEGKIITKDKDAKVEELANAGDFDAKAKEFSDVKPVIKTVARTSDLAGRHTVINHDAQSRQAKFQQLINERKQKYPNEDYETAFNAVADSEEGQTLFVQMQRPEMAETR